MLKVEVTTEDRSSFLPRESPNEAFPPRAGDDKVSSPTSVRVVDQTAIAPFHISCLFQQSAFLNPPDKKPPANGYGDVEKPIFSPIPNQASPPPSRSCTLSRALDLQMSEIKIDASVSYDTVSEKVVRTICKELGVSSERVSSLIEDPKINEKIGQIIRAFVSERFAPRPEISFIRTQPRSRVSDVVSERTTLDYYHSILPLDLVKQAKVKTITDNPKKPYYFTCVVVASTTKNRCKRRSKLEEQKLDDLIQKLIGLPNPREFSKVVEILLDIADMVICSGTHSKKARLAIFELCKHFCTTSTSSRESELKCLDQWLRELGQGDGPKREEVEGREEEAKGKEEDVSPTGSLFRFGERSSLIQLFSINGRYEFAPSLTRDTLQVYTWSAEKRGLTAEALVQKIVKKEITNPDRTRRGYVYVYRTVESIGYVKIGHTDNVERRLLEWEDQCGYLIDECDELLRGIKRQVPHPKRLEDLIHAELKGERHQVLSCQVCHKTHDEWFKVDPTKAQRVVKKWTSWMNKEPYDEAGKFRSGKIEIPAVGDCETKQDQGTRNSRQSSWQKEKKPSGRQSLSKASAHNMTTRSKDVSS